MNKLYIPDNSIEIAKELAFEVEISDEQPTEDLLVHTLELMNGALAYDPIATSRQLMSADLVYEIPDHEADIEMLSEVEVMASIREKVAFAAKIEQFVWFGCVSFRGFGLRVWGIDYKTPSRHHVPTGFVPLDNIVAIIPS